MSHYDDGRPRPLIRPKRYPIRNQEDWPEPEETPEMDPVEFCELLGAQQVDHVHTLSASERLLLLYRLSTELALMRRAATNGQPCECCVAEPGCPRCTAGLANGPLCGKCCDELDADVATRDLEAIPAADLAMGRAAENYI